MSRYLLQSSVHYGFLHSCPVTGDIKWTHSLPTALAFGLITDEDQVAQMIEDHCDRAFTLTIDLDHIPDTF
ncbi:MAG: hypothetical protein V4532_19360 [Pseudomonadota bacterium]